jgi:hypothetical protein
MGGDQGAMGGLVLADLRQVQHHHFRRAKDDGAGERGRARIAGRQIIGGPILAHRLDPARLGISDGYQPEFHLTAVMGEPDHVGGIEGQL